MGLVSEKTNFSEKKKGKEGGTIQVFLLGRVSNRRIALLFHVWEQEEKRLDKKVRGGKSSG